VFLAGSRCDKQLGGTIDSGYFLRKLPRWILSAADRDGVCLDVRMNSQQMLVYSAMHKCQKPSKIC